MVVVLKQAFLSQQLAADLHMGKDNLFPSVLRSWAGTSGREGPGKCYIATGCVTAAADHGW